VLLVFSGDVMLDLSDVFKGFVSSASRILNVDVPTDIPNVSFGDFGFDLSGRWFGVRREGDIIFVSRGFG